MSATVGSVNLRYPLARQNPNEPVVLGSDTMVCDGSTVTLEYENPVQDMRVKYIFNWESLATVLALQALWKAGGSYSVSPEGTGGPTFNARFARQKGVDGVKNVAFGERAIHSAISGNHNDAYTGEINLIIEAP